MSEPQLDAALHRAVIGARDKREQRGATGDGTIVLSSLEPDEALALDGLLSPRRPILPGRALRIRLSQLEAALRACGIDPSSAYEAVGGRPLRDLPAERAAAGCRRADFRAWLETHEVARSRPAVATWLQAAADQGRIRADIQPLVEQALRIIAVLPPGERMQRTVLAAGMLDGNSHGLDVDRPLHGLITSVLAAAANLDPGTPAREIWSAWNVLVDPVSSSVTALNLPLLGETGVAHQMRAMRGTHVILTYGQLSASTLTGTPSGAQAGELRWPRGVPCFSCENPSVLIAVEQALGQACPPLVCTGGRPSDAVRLLFSSVHRSGAQIRHHGDFDDAGVQILRNLEDRYGAVPWRFDVESLCAALRRLGRTPLDPRPATLERAVQQLGAMLPEELVIDDLVSDLTAIGRTSA